MARKCHGFPPLDRSDGASDSQRLAAVADAAEKSTTKLPTLIYLNLPAQAQHHLWHDMRTGPRITYWNNRLRAVAERSGFTVIDIEGYTAPGAIDQRNADGIHCTCDVSYLLELHSFLCTSRTHTCTRSARS